MIGLGQILLSFQRVRIDSGFRDKELTEGLADDEFLGAFQETGGRSIAVNDLRLAVEKQHTFKGSV
jgi:hypothetical protein